MTDERHKARARKQAARLKAAARHAIGTQCVWCGTHKDVHAAHVMETAVSGSARGQNRRNRDIVANPDAYRPMCAAHHRLWDKLRALSEKQEPIPF